MPAVSRVGDKICIVKTVDFPLIMRPLKEEEHLEPHTFVGPCYVHGIMDGEVAALVGSTDVQEETIHII